MLKKKFYKLFDKIYKIESSLPVKVAIIEDDKYYSQLVKANLLKLGIEQITVYNSGEEFKSKYLLDKPDLIILDHKLSDDGLNGIDVLKYIKSSNDSDICVVVLSGQEKVEVAAEMIRLGSFDYIIKNDMTFFNVDNTITRFREIRNLSHVYKCRQNRLKFIFLIMLISIWVSFFFMFI